MRHKFLNSLMSIVVVLVTCSFAYGQPAWILWDRTTIVPIDHKPRSWEMVERFPDYERCMLGLKKHWENNRKLWQLYVSMLEKMREDEAVREDMKTLHKLLGLSPDLYPGEEEIRGEVRGEPYEIIMISIMKGKGISSLSLFEFKCFPDTIDPRKKVTGQYNNNQGIGQLPTSGNS